ncbi:good for full DBP5 activity protein 2 [Cladorrhinum sp. PSN332]|nr:good for full DBP5 activity protein 2 [Cladorrhinum sp. PSN332]
MDQTNSASPVDLEREREEDAEFLRRIIALSGGDPAMFEGFDPSGWRSIDPNELDDDAPLEVDSDDETGGLIPTARNFRNATRVSNDFDRPIRPNKARRLAADVPDIMRNPDQLEQEGLRWEETGFELGQVAPETQTFVPWKLVQNYTDMYAGKMNGERAAPLFTLEALHHNRVWDLYYLHQPKQMGDHPPVLFVPTYQFQHLLDVVNAKLEINFTIPSNKNEGKFKLRFGVGGGPRPRFLSRSSSATHFNELHDKIPDPKDEDDLSNATNYGRETLLEIFQMISKAASKTKKSERSHYKRTKAHREWGKALKRAQRYLGLREKASERVDGTTPKMLNLGQPVVAKPELSVLFVCIDVEAYEFNQDLITEVGISVLDTTKLEGVAPGVNGQNWFSLIDARHIRIEENIWAVNSRYVRGCADQFSFGNTEVMRLGDIPTVVEEIIDNAAFGPAGLNTEPRPVVLVFHDASADIKYLQTAGYNIYAANNVTDILDTKDLHKYALRTNDTGSLESVLRYLEIPSHHLHNAGNDAVYTLRAMLGLAVKKRAMSLESALTGQPKGYIPVNEFKEKEGWTSGGEDSDGGEPVRPAQGWN